mmetsp:Transcript_11216/g.23686  ORF Transcript_11216/g.23686 Transcript_11216/m.23686 type:complete len:249 (-) Transcript_11216:1938-2684(-)
MVLHLSALLLHRSARQLRPGLCPDLPGNRGISQDRGTGGTGRKRQERNRRSLGRGPGKTTDPDPGPAQGGPAGAETQFLVAGGVLYPSDLPDITVPHDNAPATNEPAQDTEENHCHIVDVAHLQRHQFRDAHISRGGGMDGNRQGLLRILLHLRVSVLFDCRSGRRIEGPSRGRTGEARGSPESPHPLSGLFLRAASGCQRSCQSKRRHDTVPDILLAIYAGKTPHNDIFCVRVAPEHERPPRRGRRV